MTKPGRLTDIGFVGLGNMGTPMTCQLISAGFTVHGYDIDLAAVARLVDAGGSGAENATAVAAASDVVILMLPDSGTVETVLRDPGMVRSLRPDAIVVDMSSSEPLRTQALAAELAERGQTLIDAPVSGGVARAVTGKLTIMAGGDPDVIDRLVPVLSALGEVTRVGDVGAGHALKALNNLLSATHLLATSAAVQTGERFGLDPKVMLSVINRSSGQSASSENKLPHFILPRTYDSGFGLRLMLKDMRIAVGLSRELGCQDPLGEKAVALWAAAAAQLPAQADHTEIARWVEGEASPPQR